MANEELVAVYQSALKKVEAAHPEWLDKHPAPNHLMVGIPGGFTLACKRCGAGITKNGGWSFTDPHPDLPEARHA